MKKWIVSVVCLVFLFVAPAVRADVLGTDALDTIKNKLAELNLDDVTVDLNVRIPVPGTVMQPPTELFATVIRHGNAKKPTILVATPYRREMMTLLYIPLLARDYNLMGLDIRGTGSSNGEWVSFAPEEHFDTAHVIDKWIPEQEWSDGKVGMIGPSYMAIIQFMASGQIESSADGTPIHLKALFPMVSMSDAYFDIVAHGANLDLEFIPMWLGLVEILGVLPPLLGLGEEEVFNPSMEELVEAQSIWDDHIKNIPIPFTWFQDIDNELPNQFFEYRSPMIYWPDKPAQGWNFSDYPGMPIGTIPSKLPVFMTGGWFDIFTRGTLNNYTYGLKNHAIGDKALVMGPWYHIDGSLGVGMNGLMDSSIVGRWFDWKIKGLGDPFMKEFPVLLYIDGIGKWRAEKDWPLAASRVEKRQYYLSKKEASTITDDWFSTENAKNNYRLVETPTSDDYTRKIFFGLITVQRDNPVLKHDPLSLHGLVSRSSNRWLMGMFSLVSQISKFMLGKDIDKNQYFEDERSDEVGVLTFTTEPLAHDIEISGPLTVTFWAKTKFGGDPSAIMINSVCDYIEANYNMDSSVFTDIMTSRDVQWVVEVNDVFPDGRARNISSGWLNSRARPYDPGNKYGIDPAYAAKPFDPFYYHHGFIPDFIEENETYGYALEVWPMDNVFKAGHRIRVSLSASDFPHLLPVLRASNNTIVINDTHKARIDFNVVKTTGENLTWKWVDDANTYLKTHKN